MSHALPPDYSDDPSSLNVSDDVSTVPFTISPQDLFRNWSSWQYILVNVLLGLVALLLLISILRVAVSCCRKCGKGSKGSQLKMQRRKSRLKNKEARGVPSEYPVDLEKANPISAEKARLKRGKTEPCQALTGLQGTKAPPYNPNAPPQPVPMRSRRLSAPVHLEPSAPPPLETHNICVCCNQRVSPPAGASSSQPNLPVGICEHCYWANVRTETERERERHGLERSEGTDTTIRSDVPLKREKQRKKR